MIEDRGIRQKGVRSVEIAADLLTVFADAPGQLMLTEVARLSGMSASRAHSYLVSLVRTGLVEQDTTTGRYELGPRTVQLGLRALNRVDAVVVATQAVLKLRKLTDFTHLLVVWGERGATLIRWDRSPTRPLMINVNVGSTLPLLTTAAGRLFLAYMPREATDLYVRNELAMLGAQDRSFPIRKMSDVETLIDEIRASGLARAEGILFPAQTAVAAPIFDDQGQIVAAISMTTFGDEAEFAENAESLDRLRAVTAEASAKLGHGGPPTRTESSGRMIGTRAS